MRARLEEITDRAFKEVGRGDPDRARHFKEDIARAQVADLIEYVWVAVPEPAGEDGYAIARRRAQHLLAARKNTRMWTQPSWAAAGVVKSSLDGARESVLDERLFDRPRGSEALPAEVRRRRFDWYRVHGAERLCGVGLLKRFGRFEHEGQFRVFSTSHVAALPFLEGLERQMPATVEPYNRLCDELDAVDQRIIDELDVTPRRSDLIGNIDAGIFFPGRLDELLDELAIDGSKRERARSALASFLRGRPEPIPYYAILMADGDGMGAVIDAQRSFEQHRTLSAALNAFADRARAIVEEHRGHAIYAGGDDVLALLPIHTVLACAAELEAAFTTALAPWRSGDGGGTLSIGVALSHHVAPLDGALDMARHAEKVAKQRPGKNGLAIVVHKRGGAPVTVAGSFRRDGGVVDDLERLIWFCASDAVSAKAGYELGELARLGDPDVVAAEVTRVLFRKKAERGAFDLAEEVRDALQQLVKKRGVQWLGDALYVAKLFAQARALAAPAPEKGAQ